MVTLVGARACWETRASTGWGRGVTPRPLFFGAQFSTGGEISRFGLLGAFVHRDIKPTNILLDELGHPRLTDFDLVAAADSTGGTGSGVGMGTIVYAAPEALEDARHADCRSDVYSLGMTLVSVLCGGKLPGQASFQGVAYAQWAKSPPELLPVVARATALDPSARYQTVGDLCQALDAALHPPVEDPTPVPARVTADDEAGPSTATPMEGQSTALRRLFRLPGAYPLRAITAAALTAIVLAVGWSATRQQNLLLVPPTEPPDSVAATLLVGIDSDRQAEKWSGAIEKAGKVLTIPGVSTKLRESAQSQKEAAEKESKSHVIYERFVTAAGGSHYDQALSPLLRFLANQCTTHVLANSTRN